MNKFVQTVLCPCLVEKRQRLSTPNKHKISPPLNDGLIYGKGTIKFFLFEGVDAAAKHEKGYYTNSIMTIGAPSPRRGPSFMIRVYPP